MQRLTHSAQGAELKGKKMNTYKVTKAFYADHLSRDCGNSADIVKETKTHYTLALTADTYADLLSDAQYYTDPDIASEMWNDYRGVVMSAKATLKVLLAQPFATLSITTASHAWGYEMSCACGWAAKCLTSDEASQWVAGHESTQCGA